MMTVFNILYCQLKTTLVDMSARLSGIVISMWYLSDIYVSGECAATGLHFPAEVGGICPDVRHGVCDPVCRAIDEGDIWDRPTQRLGPAGW